MKTLQKNNLILGDLLVSLAASTNLGKQEVLDLLTNSIGLQLIGMTPSGEKFHLEIGEFLTAELEVYDAVTGIEIEEADLLI